MLCIVLFLAACAPETPVIETPTDEPEIATDVPAMPEPTDTPFVAVASPTVLLVSSSDADPFARSQIQRTLESLAADSSLSLVVLEELSPETITPEVQVVVGVGANLDLTAFAQNSPEVTFVGVDNPNVTVLENLSVIGATADELRQKAFMAGYLSALISDDYKIAALIASDSGSSDLVAESYVVGGRFLCGICKPLYPPYNPFPQWEVLSSEFADAGFEPTIDYFNNIAVEVLYVQGELASPELLAYLAALDMKVISDQTPDVVPNNWVGTIITDPAPALETLWPNILAGTAGLQISAAITLRDSENDLISEGRYRLFEEMVTDLQAGLVSIDIAP